MEMKWIPTNRYSGVPPNGVFAGQDSDGAAIYVGRAYHNGDLLPAKFIPNKQAAYISHDGDEISKNDIEVLVGQGFTWIPSSGGSVPPNSVKSGTTANGEPLYIGRGHYEGSLTPGKVHQSHGVLYLPYGGSECSLRDYEVLVNTNTWISRSGDSVPTEAVFAGQDSDGSPIYVGRVYHEGEQLPAKIIPNRHVAYVAHNGQEIAKYDYEFLTGQSFTWVASASGHVPQGSVIGGATSTGETLYIGRGHVEGSLTPGKIHPSHGVLYVPYGGSERSLSSYEVLVRSSF